MNYFKGKQFQKDVIIVAVGYYLRYNLSYREIQELLYDRGINVCHTTIYRWVQEYSKVLYHLWKKKNRQSFYSWKMDETYIKIKGRWHYLYRAIDADGLTLDIWLRKKRDTQAAYAFLKRLHKQFGEPKAIVTDKAPSLGSAFRKLLDEHQLLASYSKPGYPYDNAVTEVFFKYLKQREINRRTYHSIQEVQLSCFEYIEQFYNNYNPHSANNGLTPNQKEENYFKKWKGYNKLDTKLREIVERFIMARRKFDKQFKNSAVKLILEEGYSVKEVSQELEVHANSLYRWVQEVEEYGESAFPGNGTALADAQHKIKLLEKENRYLQEELELLKKFRVFLKRSK
ncbi:hypothetical protein Llc71_26590 (plasmid) [Lactococcus cremoris]|nr:hypothetical protein Llc71_26590 [Lactococcus cremoris]